MRTALDVLRSVQRYVSLALPEPWDIRIGIENETPERPFALVTRNGRALPVGSFGAHTVRLQQALTVHLYVGPANSREEAELIAAGLEETMFRLFKSEGKSPATRADVVPLWDFVNDTTSGVDPPRSYCDYAAVSRYEARSLPDPQNPRMTTTIVDLALAWFRAGTQTPAGIHKVAELRPTRAEPPATDV